MTGAAATPAAPGRRRAAFRLTRPVVPEDVLHASVADALAKLLLPPAEWWAYPAGHIRLDGQQAAKLYRMGLRPSLPDFMVLCGALIGIELKTETGRLSRPRMVHRKRNGGLRLVEGQTTIFPRLAAAGMRGPHVCRSVEDVLCVLRAEGVPIRGCSL
jgi:hypothetical protein